MTDTATLMVTREQLADRLDSNAEAVRAAIKRYNTRRTSSKPTSDAYVAFLDRNEKVLQEALRQTKALNQAFMNDADLSSATIEATEQAIHKVLQLETEEPKRRPSLFARIADKRAEKRIESALSEAGWHLEHIQDALDIALNTAIFNGTERLTARSAFWNSVSLDPDLSRAIDNALESIARDEASHTRGVQVFKTELARLSNPSAMATANGIEKLFGTSEPALATA